MVSGRSDGLTGNMEEVGKVGCWAQKVQMAEIGQKGQIMDDIEWLSFIMFLAPTLEELSICISLSLTL